MKLFFSEHNKDYQSYTFDYAVYAMMEDIKELPDIYQSGFLPYSNDLSDPQEMFYLARSLRVELNDFSDSSENRRVDRKLKDLQLELRVISKSEFNFNDITFRNLCLDYAKERFSGNAMTEERFEYVVQRQVLSHIIRFSKKDNSAAGYVFALIEGNTLHYWYSFFDLAIFKHLPLGKWLMWRTIKWAKDIGLDYVYLGTCYGKKSLYKVRDFKSLAFFDGTGWNQDMNLLKKWCKNDDVALPTDRFKIKDL